MNSLSIFGTSSDAGKSTLSFAITYLLHHRGIKVAPFKAQNVSNNSLVTDINAGEIAIPQAFAAEAIGLKTTPYMNPILLKSGAGTKAHLILNGKSIGEKDIWNYFKNIKTLSPHVSAAFKTLQKEYDVIVAEGAGSPVELNLMKKDLSNIYVAKKFHTKIVIVADIECGGVFASIYGLYNLLPKKLRKNVVGVIINKFRGDIKLFDKGREIIEKRFGIKVLGVIPYKAFNLGFEDSQSLMNYTQNTNKAKITLGVIALPHISNFTDFEPLVADHEIALRFITNPNEAMQCDAIIIPGSKRVVDDMIWLQEQGFQKIIANKKRVLIGICGGYEMLFESIYDPHAIESKHKRVQGFGRFKGSVVFQKKKIVKKGSYNIWGIVADGYEIHNARAVKNAKHKKNLYGTFMHGIFENDALRLELFSQLHSDYHGYNFKEYKAKAIHDFAQHVDKHLNMEYLQNVLAT